MFYRSDNRSPDQLRPINIIPNFINTAEGSVLIELGNTRVICTASVEETVPQFMRNRGKGWISSEYSMLPRATLTRTPREVSKGRPSGRTHEIQRLIGRSLRAVTDLEHLGERTVWIDCDVIQADGGTRTASVTGAFVALGLALEKLVEAGTLTSVPFRDYLAAVSVGIVDGEILLDLAYEEDSRADVDMNFVMTAGRKLVEVQATAEHQVFDEEQLSQDDCSGQPGSASADCQTAGGTRNPDSTPVNVGVSALARVAAAGRFRTSGDARAYTFVPPLLVAKAVNRGAPQALIASSEPNKITASILERPSRTK